MAPSPHFKTVNGPAQGSFGTGYYLSSVDDFGIPLGSNGDAEHIPILTSVPGIDLADVDTTAARVGYNLRTGLSDEGIMYLRLGPPDQQLIGSTVGTRPGCGKVMNDVQRWHYPGLGWVRFATPAAFDAGQAIGTPVFSRPCTTMAMPTG